MKSPRLLAVNIVTYNSANSIGSCLEAVRRQTGLEEMGFRARILVIDNASSDGTVDLIRGAGGADMDVMEAGQNLGYAAAHNLAIRRSEGKYVLTLNPDVWLTPDYLRHMVTALEADARLGSAAGCLLRVEHLGDTPAIVDGAGLYMRRSRRQGLIADSLPVSERPAARVPIFGPDGAAALYRRSMLDDVAVDGEVFDTDFFMHKEDVDLCWRAAWLGWRSVYVPEAIGHHMRGFRPGQRGRVSAYMRFLGARNRYLLLMKNDVWPHLLRDALPILTYEAGILAYLLLRERESLKAYGAAWALRHKMRAKRRATFARRRRSPREMREQVYRLR